VPVIKFAPGQKAFLRSGCLIAVPGIMTAPMKDRLQFTSRQARAAGLPGMPLTARFISLVVHQSYGESVN